MDINKALALLRDGKLRDCHLDELRAMSAGSMVFIQNRIPDAVHLKAAVDDEILRKEAQEAESRAKERYQALQISVDRLAHPKWIEWAILIVTAIAMILGLLGICRT
ncbi:MAG: hypothetical protein IH623_27890 [Verrucomicrobia bacterium]|nr:hypothetical protein [Verrucomicrobiota bacterium]